jgi:hypothetical protein
VKDIKKRMTAEAILKTPWIEKGGTGNIDFARVCTVFSTFSISIDYFYLFFFLAIYSIVFDCLYNA